MNRTVSWTLFAAVALAGIQWMSAQTPQAYQGPAPHIIPLGSPFVFGGTNAPDTYSATGTFSSTPVIVDNGAVKIWQQQVATAANAEWDIFFMQTVNGGPLAGNINGYWNILMNYTLSANAIFDAVVNQWAVSGTPVSPLTNGIGTICCAAATNPIIPGESYYNSGFSGPLTAGVQTNWQQVFVTPYNIVSNGGVNPSTANQFTFALHFTLPAAAPIVTGAISASQFGGFHTFGPGSWIEIYGTNLAAGTQGWGSSDFNGVLAPTTLGGTSVTIGGQSAFVDYISPLQVNVQVPNGVASGTQPLIVTAGGTASAPFSVTVDAVQPGLLAPPTSFNLNGTQYLAALFPDGVTYVLPPGAIAGLPSRRAKPGDIITLYGVGFGVVSPNIPPGQIAELSSAIVAPFTVSIGGTQAHINYAGQAPTFVGLYQFNVVIPNIAASDTTPVTFSLNGVNGTQTFSIPVGN